MIPSKQISYTAHGTITTDGIGGIVVQPGSVGIQGAAIVAAGPSNGIKVTFTKAFLNANYTYGGDWFPVAPGILPETLGRLGQASADPRTPTDVTFVVMGPGEVDPATNAINVMFRAA